MNLPHRLPVRFAPRLFSWADRIDRPLPWREETDPYRIWLSEILLQQTRAETVIDYYNRFLKVCPSVHHLSELPIGNLLKLWEGLGYYNRAHNLHRTAQIISRERDGLFPDSYEDLLSLPGIGPYTAAAIASFAFGRAHAVLDGNVIRVISRLIGLEEPVDQIATRRHLQNLANQLLAQAEPARFNQAIMDFGAIQCTPRNPACEDCPFSQDCLALQMDRVDQLPVKQKKQPVTDRTFVFFIFQKRDTLWLVERENKDIWPRLHTFPAAEITGLPIRKRKAHLRKILSDWTGHEFPFSLEKEPLFNQLLSHQCIHGHFIRLALPDHSRIPSEWLPVRQGDFSNHAMPRMMRRFLTDYFRLQPMSED